METKLMHAFKSNSGILTVKKAETYGISHAELEAAAEQEIIHKYNDFIYYQDYLYFDDLYFMQLQYPQGVFSHETAVMLHELSTYSPFYFHIAFPENHDLSTDPADENPVRSYYIPEFEQTDEFVEVIDSWDSNPIRVTNLEKTIVDMFRAKMAMPGIVDEMIKDYIVRDDTNIQRLIKYGELFNVMTCIEKDILPFMDKQ